MPASAIFSADNTMDAISAEFRKHDLDEMPLKDIIAEIDQDGFGDAWDIPAMILANGLRTRGLELRDGVVRLPLRPDGQAFDPVVTDFRDFLDAAKRIVSAAEQPVKTEDLLSQIGLAKAAIPYSSMRNRLQKVGVYFLPGAGYWLHPQYTMPDGRQIVKRVRNVRDAALLDLFEKIGWPIVSRDADEQTHGLVYSSYLARQHALRKLTRSVGHGLYVPADLLTPLNPLPMSRNVADALASIDDMIDDRDHFRLFRIGLKVRDLGWADVKLSRTKRDGIRRQTMTFAWTEVGKDAIRARQQPANDVF